MTVMFHDIHTSDKTKNGKTENGTEFDEVIYADDTIRIAQDEAAIDRLLKAIEEQGQHMD